jgi:hypothetical protein
MTYFIESAGAIATSLRPIAIGGPTYQNRIFRGIDMTETTDTNARLIL